MPGAGPDRALAQDRAHGPEMFRALDWRQIGPYRGGRAVAVAGVASRPEVFYMGATGGGVWKTTDAGETWEPTPADLTALPSSDEWAFPPRPHTHHVRWLAVDPRDPEHLFVAVEAGALHALIGPNAAGKTTLLELMLGRLRPRSGRRGNLARATRLTGPLARVPPTSRQWATARSRRPGGRPVHLQRQALPGFLAGFWPEQNTTG